MASQVESSFAPTHEQDELVKLYRGLRDGDAKLIGPDGNPQSLPSNLHSFLDRLLADLHAGNSVTLLTDQTALTTVEAAKLLAVSRQFLIGLLQQNQIPYHMVGTHRRIYARDVLTFKAKRDSARRKALDDLARSEFEAGTYDLIPYAGDAAESGS